MASNRNIGARERRVEPHDSLDDFPTPPWAARAACEYVVAMGWADRGQCVLEPAVNRGAFWTGLIDYFETVHASDIFAYPECVVRNAHTPVDFLLPGGLPFDGPLHWVMTNPPFRLAAEFIHRALDVASVGCVMLLRGAFTEGAERYETLFRPNPPTQIVHFCERVVMLKGRLIRAGDLDPVASADKGKPVKASIAKAHSLFIWKHGADRLPCDWIPPGSWLRLEREGDYDLF